MKLIIISFTVLLINFPFGYWRANVGKYSFQWALSIHIPILIVILERILGHLGFGWITYPVMILAFFFGQYFGSKLYHYLKIKRHFAVSSCIFMDCLRNCF